MTASFRDTLDEVVALYHQNDRPWIVGFSGGKDSTAVLQLVFQALSELPSAERVKPVHVVSNDTLVEIPRVASMVGDALEKIGDAAKRIGLPIITAQTRPQIDDSFFVNLIGRGYPSPTSHFRWCTERMKIGPTTEYIRRVVDQQGEVIILLGARKAESATRAQALANRTIEGSKLKRHSTLPRCLVYTPIEDWDTREVWVYLFQVPSPWGADNKELFRLYSRADGGECPLVIDSTTPSCGNSRFGCWVCTVVEHDRAIEGFIESGDESLEPLLTFRNFLKEVRSKRQWRERVRKNGQVLNQKGDEVWGPFTLEARKAILRKLLETEEQAGIKLISVDELSLIQKLWRQGDRSYNGPQADTCFSVSAILRQVKGEANMTIPSKLSGNGDREDKLLLEICQKYGIRADIVERLRAAEEKVSHLQRRDGIFNDIEDIFDQALPSSTSRANQD